MIEPYVKNEQIFMCPSKDTPNTHADYYHSLTNYAIRTDRSGKPLAYFEEPSSTFIYTDSTSFQHSDANTDRGLERIHHRHNGMANIAYIDGHAKAGTLDQLLKSDPFL